MAVQIQMWGSFYRFRSSSVRVADIALPKVLEDPRVPEVDAAREAGKLLEDLPQLWQEATLSESRQTLLTMLDAVYVDAKEEKAVVAIQPKPAFKTLFDIATTRNGRGVVLIIMKPQDFSSLETSVSCSWWRQGSFEPQHNKPGFITEERWNVGAC